MNSFAIFQVLFDQLETPFLAGISALVASFSNYARAPIQAALILYIAITGYFMLTGHGTSLNTTMERILKLCLVAWFATDATAYTSWVQNFFLTQLPADLAQAVVQGNGGRVATNAAAFDIVWKQAWQAGLVVWQRLSVTDIGEEAVVIAFWLAAILSVGIAFAIWLMSQIVLGLFIIVGPLMIGLALFGATKSVFSRWIGALLSSMLLQVGILILLSLTIRTTAGLVVQILTYHGTNAYEQIGLLLNGIIVFLLCGILAFQMPSWASSLAGGMSFHGGALAYIMLTQMRGASSLAGRAGGAASKAATAIRNRVASPAPRSKSS